MKKIFTREVRISLSAIAALVLLVFVVNFLKGINLFKPESYYYIVFENVSQLAKSSPVYVDGYSVGLVSDILYDYNRPGHVVVEVDVNEKMRIPEGSYAQITTGLLGAVDMHIYLNRETDRYLQVGDTLQGLGDKNLMGTLSNSVMPTIQQMIPKLDSALITLNRLLSNPELSHSIDNIGQITTDLRETTVQLNRLLESEVPQFMDNLNKTGENAVAITGNLREIDYTATFDKVDSALTDFQLLADKLNRSDNSLGLLLNDTAFYYQYERAGRNAAELLEDIRENPKRYVHFSLFGRKDKTIESKKK